MAKIKTNAQQTFGDKIQFDPDIPDSVKAELARQLVGYAWLVPGWCQRVFVGWQEKGDDKGTLVSCSAMYEYRNIRLTFYPAFLSEGELQPEHVIHDLLHGFTSVMADYAHDRINLLVPESEAPKFRESLLDELRVRHESFVQDLAFCLAQKFKQDAQIS